MGLFDALFNKKKERDGGIVPAAPAPDVGPSPEVGPADGLPDDGSGRLGMLVAFAGPLAYTPESLRRTLVGMDAALRQVTVQGVEGTAEQGTPVTRVAWGDHVVDLFGLDVPLPAAVVEDCVQPAHYAQPAKAAVRAHRTHAVLFYSGASTDPREGYVALAIVAGAFAKHGAVGVLHEAAMTSVPAEMLYQLASAQENFAVLRVTPLLLLFCGFVKYFLPGGERAWMRTYNSPRFGLPDLAADASLDEGQDTFDLFSALMDYQLDSGKRFALGHTAQFGDRHLRFRAPRDDEPFPTDTAGQLLIVETDRL